MNKEKAIRLALAEAEIKHTEGKLVKDQDWVPEIHDNDCETVYSIASLYADQKEDDGTWEDSILYELKKEYESFFLS